jgi:hypothetical protein
MVYTLCVNLKHQVYLSESDAKLKFKENISQQFTLPCNINHRKYVTSQSNDVTAVWGLHISEKFFSGT